MNGKFTENNSKLVETFPITAIRDVEGIIRKLMEHPDERKVLDMVRLLKYHDVCKEFQIKLLEGLNAGDFYNDHYDYYFHELLMEAIVKVLVRKGLKEEDIGLRKEVIGEDLGFSGRSVCPPWGTSTSTPSGFIGSKSSVLPPFRVTPPPLPGRETPHP
jgi:hypothetical protein